jgi:type II secretion system protein C
LGGFALSAEPGERYLLRQGLLALQVSLAACSAYLVYATLAALLFSPSVPEAAVPEPLAPTARSRPLADYDVITSRNLFNTTQSALAEAPLPAIEEIAESQLAVRLLGTIVGGPGQESLAAVEDSSQVRIQVGVDDLISGARVVRIERDRIILDNQGRLEEIAFPEDGSAGVAIPPPPRSLRPQRTTPLAARPTESLSERLRKLAQQAQPAQPAGSPGGYLDQMRVLPSYDVQGGLEGLKVSWVQEGSPVAQSGIQVGDLITGVNGAALTSPTEGIQAFRDISPGNPIAVEAVRAGSTISLLLQAAR